MRELLVGTVSDAATALGMSNLFVGVVVIAVIGNVAEHYSAVVLAALRAHFEQVERESPAESAQQALTADSLTLLADAIHSFAERKQLSSRRSAWRQSNCGALPPRIAAVSRARSSNRNGGGEPCNTRPTWCSRSSIATGSSRSRSTHGCLHRAAASRDDDPVLRRQPDVIERFFHRAGEALRRIDATL
jgi:hypothetical protein